MRWVCNFHHFPLTNNLSIKEKFGIFRTKFLLSLQLCLISAHSSKCFWVQSIVAKQWWMACGYEESMISNKLSKVGVKNAHAQKKERYIKYLNTGTQKSVCLNFRNLFHLCIGFPTWTIGSLIHYKFSISNIKILMKPPAQFRTIYGWSFFAYFLQHCIRNTFKKTQCTVQQKYCSSLDLRHPYCDMFRKFKKISCSNICIGSEKDAIPWASAEEFQL